MIRQPNYHIMKVKALLLDIGVDSLLEGLIRNLDGQEESYYIVLQQNLEQAKRTYDARYDEDKNE